MAARARAGVSLPTTVGVKPHAVWVGARADKGGTLYLRWRRGDNWGWKSLRVRLDALPAADRAAATVKAYEAALDMYQRLSGQRAAPAERLRAPATLGTAWALLTDPKRGAYPIDTPYRRELAFALRDAAKILGKDFPLQALDAARLREVTRGHADRVMRRGGVGFRAAEVLGTRLLTIVRKLQEEGAVAEDAPIPHGRAWHADLRKYCEERRGQSLPPVHRPRYTLEEFRALLRVAPQVDPRFALAITLGFELRPGQVARARRADLDLEAGEFTVHGRGNKGGTTIALTAGQLAAAREAVATGYLRDCEAARATDPQLNYPLFPGALGPKQVARARADFLAPSGLMGRTQIKKWIREAEALAQIPHVRGRGWYGGRRTGVDGSLDAGASPGALQNIGGWSDSRTPNETYRERGRAQEKREARDVRAKVRGEDAESKGGADDATA